MTDKEKVLGLFNELGIAYRMPTVQDVVIRGRDGNNTGEDDVIAMFTFRPDDSFSDVGVWYDPF